MNEPQLHPLYKPKAKVTNLEKFIGRNISSVYHGPILLPSRVPAYLRDDLWSHDIDPKVGPARVQPLPIQIGPLRGLVPWAPSF